MMFQSFKNRSVKWNDIICHQSHKVREQSNTKWAFKYRLILANDHNRKAPLLKEISRNKQNMQKWHKILCPKQLSFVPHYKDETGSNILPLYSVISISQSHKIEYILVLVTAQLKTANIVSRSTYDKLQEVMAAVS